jgi:hypothetical protein
MEPPLTAQMPPALSAELPQAVTCSMTALLASARTPPAFLSEVEVAELPVRRQLRMVTAPLARMPPALLAVVMLVTELPAMMQRSIVPPVA